jgi:REP element-mobilizing transposase RayT
MALLNFRAASVSERIAPALPYSRGSDRNDQMPNDPLAFFITFSTYGSWLHGKEPGSVDPTHNQHDTPFLPGDPRQESEERGAMTQPAFVLDAPRRRVVLATILDVCRHRGWRLVACHVRSNHVHLVVQADAPPEKVMNDCKAYASRRLSEAGFDDRSRRRWTRHGSTKYLWSEDSLHNAVDYVLNRQGDQMETYHDAAALGPLPYGRGSDSEPRP